MDAIVAMRTVKGGGLEYLVRWLNPADQIPESWEPCLEFPGRRVGAGRSVLEGQGADAAVGGSQRGGPAGGARQEGA